MSRSADFPQKKQPGDKKDSVFTKLITLIQFAELKNPDKPDIVIQYFNKIKELIVSAKNIEPNDKTELLTFLAESGQAEIFDQLLKRMPGIPFNEIRKLLPLALKGGHDKIVERLLDSKMDPDMKLQADRREISSLMYAAQKGHDNIVKLLLEKKANPSQATEDGVTPLFYSAQYGHEHIVQRLLASKVDPNQKTMNNRTPLFAAAAQGNLNNVRALLDAKADHSIAWDGGSPLAYAAAGGHDNVVQLLLLEKADPQQASARGGTPLFFASADGHNNIIQMLFDNKTDPNKPDNSGNTPLLFAIQSLHVNTIQLLLKIKADPNQAPNVSEVPLVRAAKLGHLDILKYLLEAKADPNKRWEYESPLLCAIYYGNLDNMRFLLEAKADPNKGCEIGSPLLFAAHQGRLDMIRCLLSAKADSNQVSNGETPLLYAVLERHKDMMQILLENKADPYIVREDGVTPFYAAIQSGYDFVKIFIDNKIELMQEPIKNAKFKVERLIKSAKKKKINIKEEFWNNKNEVTFDMLQTAVFFENKELVQILLNQGFDPRKKIDNLPNALKIAKTMKYTHIEKLLQDHGKQKQKEKQIEQEKNKDAEGKLQPIEQSKEETTEEKKEIKQPEEKEKSILTKFCEQTKIDSKRNKASGKTMDLFGSLINKKLELNVKQLDLFLDSLILLKNKMTLTADDRLAITEGILNNKKLTLPLFLEIMKKLNELQFTKDDYPQKNLTKYLADELIKKNKLSLKELREMLSVLINLGFNQEMLENSSCGTFLLRSVKDIFDAKREVEEEADKMSVYEDLIHLGFRKEQLASSGVVQSFLSVKHDMVTELSLLNRSGFKYKDFKELKYDPIQTLEQMTTFSKKSAKSILKSLAHLKYKKSDLSETLKQKLFLPVLSKKADLKNSLPKVLWSLARLGFEKSDLTKEELASLLGQIRKDIHRYDITSIALILWSFIAMNIKANDLHPQIFEVCNRKLNEQKSFELRQASQITQAAIWFDKLTVHVETQTKMNQALAANKAPTSSQLHIQTISPVMDSLCKKKSLPLFQDEWLFKGYTHVDRCCPKLKVVIEVDGPDHDEVTDKVKDRLLHIEGYETIRLDYKDIDSCKSTHQLESYLMKEVIKPCLERQREQGKERKGQPSQAGHFKKEVTPSVPKTPNTTKAKSSLSGK